MIELSTYQERVNRFGLYEKYKLMPNETRKAKWGLAYSFTTMQDALDYKRKLEDEWGDCMHYKVKDHGDEFFIERSNW